MTPGFKVEDRKRMDLLIIELTHVKGRVDDIYGFGYKVLWLLLSSILLSLLALIVKVKS